MVMIEHLSHPRETYEISYWQRFVGGLITIQGRREGKPVLHKTKVVDINIEHNRLNFKLESGETESREFTRTQVNLDGNKAYLASADLPDIILTAAEGSSVAEVGVEIEPPAPSKFTLASVENGIVNDELRQIILVRHGSYESVGLNDILSSRGRKQIVATANLLTEKISGRPMVLCGKALRHIESSLLISQALDVPYHIHECVGDTEGEPKIRMVVELLHQSRNNTVIVVGSLPLCERVSRLLKLGEDELPIYFSDVPNGDFITIDLDGQQVYQTSSEGLVTEKWPEPKAT